MAKAKSRRPAAGTITIEDVAAFQKSFESSPSRRIAMNAVTRGNLQELALNRRVLASLDMSFSHEVETGGKITDQMRAGTCWLFAGLNWLRTFARKKLKVKSFEFSENWVVFWDKFEKCNHFLECMIEWRDRPTTDRHMFRLLQKPLPDGGEWHMLVNVIEKYGLIPKEAMADTWNLNHSQMLNKIMGYKLREGAAKLHALARKGASVADLRKEKKKLLETYYRMLCIFLGEPPEKVDYAYRDEKKKFHRTGEMSPRKFYEKYVAVDPRKYRWLVSFPTESMPFGETYTVELFNNLVEGDPAHVLNVPVEDLKDYAIKTLKGKEPVLFGCDVVQASHSKEGIMDTELFEYDLVFDTDFEMDRATRVDYVQTVLTHAMVFCGVDLPDGKSKKPKKWKVENSWGEAAGKKGFFVMTDRWFEEHVFSLLVHEKQIPATTLKLFAKKPKMLPPWNPIA